MAAQAHRASGSRQGSSDLGLEARAILEREDKGKVGRGAGRSVHSQGGNWPFKTNISTASPHPMLQHHVPRVSACNARRDEYGLSLQSGNGEAQWAILPSWCCRVVLCSARPESLETTPSPRKESAR